MATLTIEIDDDTANYIGEISAKHRTTSERTVAYLLDRTLFGAVRKVEMSIAEYVPPSIVVMVDASNNMLKHFRCNNCGNIVFDYCGNIRTVVNGRYDRDTMMIDGEDAPQSFGMPTRIQCPGRVLVQMPDGSLGRTPCEARYYKLAA
jgi:hypothetical protein